MSQFNILAAAKKAGVAAALALGVTAASAGSVFTVDPAFFGSAEAAFQADEMGSVGRTRAVLSNAFGSAAGTVTGTGFTRFTSFSLNGSPVFDSGLNSDFFLWAEFTFTMTLTGGTLGNAGSTYVLNSTSIAFYGEANDAGIANDAVFSNGDVNTDPTVAHSGDTVLLGGGALLFGVADINNLGGTSFNPTMLFGLTPNGSNFFVAPDPFYPLAFASFTNTSQGVTPGAQSLYLSTQGGVDFAPVSEPQTLALVGLALVGAGMAGRRQLRK